MRLTSRKHSEWAALSQLPSPARHSLSDHAMAALRAASPGADISMSISDLLAISDGEGEPPPPVIEAPTFVGHVSGYGTGSSARTITPHGSTQEGDLLVAVFATNNNVVTPAGGWRLLKSVVTGTLNTYVFTKRRAATETSYTFTVAGSATDTHDLISIRGAASPADAVAGPDGARASTGTSTTTVAPGVAATDKNLVLTIATERTSAVEAAATSVAGATEAYFIPQNAAVGLESLHVSTSVQGTAGTTGNVTITYPNTQATNGYGVQLAFAPATPQVHTRASVLATPFAIAHRGGGGDWPEMTKYAYDRSVAYGLKALEVSVHASSDGTLWCHHDATTTRMTGVAHTIASTSDAVLSTLSTTDNNTSNPEQGDRPMAKLVDVLDAYAATHLIVIEDKSYANSVQLLNLMDSYPNSTEHFIWKQSGDGPVIAQATARGYKTWGYFFNADMPNFAAQHSMWDYVGLDFNSSDATIASAITTAGASRCIGHIITSRAQFDRMIGLGCIGCMTSTVLSVPPQ